MIRIAVVIFAVLAFGTAAYAALHNPELTKPRLKGIELVLNPPKQLPTPVFISRVETRILPMPNPNPVQMPCEFEVDCTPEQLDSLAEMARIR